MLNHSRRSGKERMFLWKAVDKRLFKREQSSRQLFRETFQHKVDYSEFLLTPYSHLEHGAEFPRSYVGFDFITPNI